MHNIYVCTLEYYCLALTTNTASFDHSLKPWRPPSLPRFLASLLAHSQKVQSSQQQWCCNNRSRSCQFHSLYLLSQTHNQRRCVGALWTCSFVIFSRLFFVIAAAVAAHSFHCTQKQKFLTSSSSTSSFHVHGRPSDFLPLTFDLLPHTIQTSNAPHCGRTDVVLRIVGCHKHNAIVIETHCWCCASVAVFCEDLGALLPAPLSWQLRRMLPGWLPDWHCLRMMIARLLGPLAHCCFSHKCLRRVA